ncbi:uncharacterized protein LOC114178299 [Vigna unguiculata]|uniref:uncharacterized protein LOC114178299 n=1 Tax=Vigna unguiculata TaxID=3917 RepID=UPI001015CBD7|nr:uncharacterized protein LOC114178299 [Vigna unguiculata]
MESGSVYENARAYSYMACSLLKLFTRSVQNYSNSLNHTRFSTSEFFKFTLYRFLYNANTSERVSPVQSFLYDKHLAYTGMHSVPFAFTICETFRCTPFRLLSTVYATRFEQEIEALHCIFDMVDRADDKYKRQMWKYARIFGTSFFSALQTKKCPKFAFILASILKRENPAANSHILEIKQFEEIPVEGRQKIEDGCKVLVQVLRKERPLLLSLNKFYVSVSISYSFRGDFIS